MSPLPRALPGRWHRAHDRRSCVAATPLVPPAPCLVRAAPPAPPSLIPPAPRSPSGLPASAISAKIDRRHPSSGGAVRPLWPSAPFLARPPSAYLFRASAPLPIPLRRAVARHPDRIAPLPPPPPAPARTPLPGPPAH